MSRAQSSSTPIPVPRLETPEQVAERLGLAGRVTDPKGTVLRMARRGDLIGVRVSRYTMIRSDSVDRLIMGER